MPLCPSRTDWSWSENGSKARERGKRRRRVRGTTPVKTCSFCPSSSNVESEGIHIWNDLFLYKKERSMTFWEDSSSKVVSMAVFCKEYFCRDGKRQSLFYICEDGQILLCEYGTLYRFSLRRDLAETENFRLSLLQSQESSQILKTGGNWTLSEWVRERERERERERDCRWQMWRNSKNCSFSGWYLEVVAVYKK